MSYERLDKKYKDGAIWDGAAVTRIDDAIQALDSALDAKEVEVEKTYYSSNRFDKNTIAFNNAFYVSNRINTDFTFSHSSGTWGGGGWFNIPVQSGKTYTMSVTNPVTLTDMNNAVYGVFINLWFVDAAGVVVTTVPFSSSTYYVYVGSSGTDKTGLENTYYSASKVSCKAYGNGSNTYKGMRTNAVTFSVIDENITHMHVQIGSVDFGAYQISADFNTRGHLTEEEIAQIQNSFQINEGTELLEYEEGGDYTYTAIETQSNLTKLQDAFTVKEIPSTNLLKPEYAMNHKYTVNSTISSTGCPNRGTYARSALLVIPVSTGDYVLNSGEVEIGNKTFGYFGKSYFTDIDGKYITGDYGFTAADVTVGCDTTKAAISGQTSTTLKFKIIDENIKYIYVPLLDSDKNNYGLWTNYEPTTGLTDEELFSLVYQMQLNSGTKILKWQAYNDVSTTTVISPEYIDGLDTFQADMEAKIDEAVSNISISSNDEENMVCIISDNDIYVRAKQFTSSNDMVWKLAKVNQGGGNKYFNITNMNTCPTATTNEETASSLTTWKSCGDDICPPNIQGTYIAANHGFNCVDKLTVTGHDKTEADIGSVWIDSNSKTYVMTHIYDENTLGFVMFNDTNMANGKMGYGAPSAGTSLTHSSGATNTGDIAIESRAATQLWQCFNHYSIKLLVDGVEQDIDTNATLVGDRIEIMTQYDVIYIPAMLNYLMENVGNNTVDSQHSDGINDCYMTMYINYQFNKNGSVSTYSSFYINKEITVGYIGLVQSIAISSTPYTYVPDTTYEVLTLNDGSAAQNFTTSTWNSTEKAPYRYYQFSDDTAGKGMALIYDPTIGWGENTKRLEHLSQAGMFYTSKKMYPAFIAGGSLTAGTYFDGMAARVPLYKYDEDLTSVGWYWCSDDIILMIDAHNAVNKDITLPDYMNNMRIEQLDTTDTVTIGQTYIFNNKLRFISSDYGYAVLRLYK